jgi:ornithine cyclodeaminase
VALRLLTEADVRSLVDLDGAIGAVEEGFAQLARGEANLPPPMAIDIPEQEAELHFKGAYLAGRPYAVLKAATGSWLNPKRGLPVGGGLFIAFDASTGFPTHLLLDNGYLTDLRTGAAGAVAARYLARRDAGRIGVMGTGVQARHQLRCLARVRRMGEVHAWSPNADHRKAYAEEMARELAIPVVAEEEARGAVEGMDIVVTTTPTRKPILRAPWVGPGMHITAVGSDSPLKVELEPQVLAKADKVVVDRLDQCLRLGELHHAVEAGLLGPSDVHAELGEVVLGRKPGRVAEGEITVADLTGVGVQDAAIANVVIARAEERGLGRHLG